MLEIQKITSVNTVTEENYFFSGNSLYKYCLPASSMLPIEKICFLSTKFGRKSNWQVCRHQISYWSLVREIKRGLVQCDFKYFISLWILLLASFVYSYKFLSLIQIECSWCIQLYLICQKPPFHDIANISTILLHYWLHYVTINIKFHFSGF